MTPFEFVVDALAVYRLSRLVTTDTFPPIKAARDWVLLRWPSATDDYAEAFTSDIGPVNAAGRPVFRERDTWWASEPHWLGELVTCIYCSSVWVAAGVLALRVYWDWWTYSALLLALSAAAIIVSSISE